MKPPDSSWKPGDFNGGNFGSKPLARAHELAPLRQRNASSYLHKKPESIQKAQNHEVVEAGVTIR
jgi:hypothetical protein